MTDCGVTCLASVAAFYDLPYSVAQIREKALTDKTGTTVFGMLEAAEFLGFDAKAVKATIKSLDVLPLPAIAHLTAGNNLNHFVVVYSITSGMVEIMDPAVGESNHYTYDEFQNIWTSVMILLVVKNFREEDNNCT